MFGRQRKKAAAEPTNGAFEQDVGMSNSNDLPPEKSEHHHHMHMPGYNHNGHKITKGIKPDGESGRSWFHPWHFFRICMRSSCDASAAVNVLWPFVPAAIVVHFARPHDDSASWHVWKFALNYIAIVPTANLIGFAGQELARKMAKVFGIVLETFLGGLVELILFVVLIKKGGRLIPVIRSAILGSILANLLLCLGFCFFVGGLRQHEQEFHEVVSEVGSGLLLVAGFGLLIPSAFYNSLYSRVETDLPKLTLLTDNMIHVSRITAVVLLVAFFFYVFFQMQSHHGLFDSVLEDDEQKDKDRDRDLKKDKLTFTECLLALGLALACVSLHAVFLVEEIDFIVDERGVTEAFMGLILVPLVEKVAEHLTAVDEAWDDQMNFALAHVLGATIQTALFNAPLIVIVGWGLHVDMDLNFEVFNIVVLILAIIVVGNFLRDQKSNYLEGALCILIYIIIAAASWYYPGEGKNFETKEGEPEGATPTGEATGELMSTATTMATEAATAAVERLVRYAVR